MAVFQTSDAWLLISLWACNGPASLAKLQRMGDSFNHARFNEDEITEGMERLGAAGYAEMVDGLMNVTPAGESLVRALENKEGHIVWMLDLMKYMTGKPVGPLPVPGSEPHPSH
jgi:hypothetical protein